LIKNQQFYIYKLSSKRIRKSNYKINLTIEQARKNAELISISQNQVIFTVFKINGKRFDKDYLEILIDNKKEIKKLESSPENIEELINIENAINDLLFIPEIISVYIDNKKQYDSIIEKGVKVNGVEFTRLLCGAGHSRRNTVIFCAKHIEKQLKSILNNGRRIDDMVLAKNNAYFALSYSGILSVSQPYFCVVHDCEIKRTVDVELVDNKNEVSEKSMELNFNLFDGQGIISPQMAKKWAKDLHLDYVPSSFIIRNSFLKGMVCVFDFHKYSELIGTHIIKDAWGNSVNTRDMDLILTTSQFKAWQSYDSLKEYSDNCKKNDFRFGIVRTTPKQDNTSVFTNYQFLQALNLDDQQIKLLCDKTIDYFSKVINLDWKYSVLYLMGKLADIEFNDNIYNKIDGGVTKALILNNELINDSHVKNTLVRSLNRKIKESYVGNLIVDGNYSFIVQDPMAFAEYLFSQPIVGLLGEKEHYSAFWNKRNIDRVASMRAPLTWRSEVNVLNLIQNNKTEDWYKYLQTGAIIHNVHSCDMMLYADGDADGDLIMTTDQPEIIKGSYGGLPITYTKETAEKEPVIEDNLWNIDKLSFDSKIGYITNCSTTLYAMEAQYEHDTREHKEVIKRLKLCRKQQGNQIDFTKGIHVDSFPVHWTRYSKIDSSMSNEEIELLEFYNSIRINKRPYFFRYRYRDYNNYYRNYYNTYEHYCQSIFGKGLEDIIYSPQTEEERKIQEKYRKYSPLLDSDCIVNIICNYMEESINLIKYDARKKSDIFDPEILKTKKFEIDTRKLTLLKVLYEEFKTGKRNFANIRNSKNDRMYNSAEQYYKYIRNKALRISSDIQELANLAVEICYNIHPSSSKSFLWDVMKEGLIYNLEENKQDQCFIPMQDGQGDIQYLGKTYRLQKVDIDNSNYYE